MPTASKNLWPPITQARHERILEAGREVSVSVRFGGCRKPAQRMWGCGYVLLENALLLARIVATTASEPKSCERRLPRPGRREAACRRTGVDCISRIPQIHLSSDRPGSQPLLAFNSQNRNFVHNMLQNWQVTGPSCGLAWRRLSKLQLQVHVTSTSETWPSVLAGSEYIPTRIP